MIIAETTAATGTKMPIRYHKLSFENPRSRKPSKLRTPEVPSKERDKANAITVGDHPVTNRNVKSAHRCPAANVERKSKQANHVTALARTMKARIGPQSEDEPRSSLKEPCDGDSGTLASSEANREGPLTPSHHAKHTPDKYSEVGLWEVISALSIDHGRITGYHGSSQLWDCLGLFFGRLFGAHLVHKTLQMGSFCANERTLSD